MQLPVETVLLKTVNADKNEIEKQDTDVIYGSSSIPVPTGTGGSQFFICYDAFPHLDGVPTVFGQVTEGMEHVNAIKQGDKMVSVVVE